METSKDVGSRDASKGLLHQLGLINIHEEPPKELPPSEMEQRALDKRGLYDFDS